MSESEDEVQKRVEVEMQVEAFLLILEKRYGLAEGELREIVENYRWIANHRRSVHRLSWSVLLGIFGLALSGMAQAIVEGLKQFLKGP